ncbi:MAG: flagellar export chaperone FlgN [Lachnospiraceae bacterium]|nr:flagellar export chaperone FlgN [Lachnospiraceae bacterium]
MVSKYMDMLVECLEKKNQILDKLTELNKKQTNLIQDEDFSLSEFDKCVDEKGILIDNILKLDSGFEGLYNKVGKTVADNPSEYKEQLSAMQKLITQITEKSVSIQAEEERNKKLIESRFSREKSRIKSGRSQSRVALDYYNNMNKLNHVDSQFWDKKF